VAFLAQGNLTIRLSLIVLVTIRAHAQAPVADEYQVKAAFLYNFAKFVEWPPGAFRSAQDPITICLLGQNPFDDSLKEAVRGKTVEGRTFVVRQAFDAQQAIGCQILFVNSAERKRFQPMLDALKANGVLTVGESPGFAAEGGVVNFKLASGKVRLEINVDAAERAKLRVSSKLLSLAEIIKK
jgi:YfiR/HmsC-like